MKIMHVSLHDGINQNAGDTVLSAATRWLFEHTFGEIDWAYHQLWDPFDVDRANTCDAVLVGGGGLLLSDQAGASYEASGWQWNCTLEQLDALTTPLILFGIGYNQFRGQALLSKHFYTHWKATIEKAIFTGLREHVAVNWARLSSPLNLFYQPCPTTCLWQLGYDAPKKRLDYSAVGLNVAIDRDIFRFGTMMKRTKCFEDITEALRREWSSFGTEINILCHKRDDSIICGYFDAQEVPKIQRDMISHRTNLYVDSFINLYKTLDFVIGMRGHSQLIPFGLRTPIFSLISHEKLAWFLQDIGHPEWGCEILSPYLSRNISMQLELHRELKRHFRETLAIAQAQCWNITQTNMQSIQHLLERATA